MLLIFNPCWYGIIVQVVDSMVLSCVKVLGHQQSYRSVGGGVVHKHTAHCTVLKRDICHNQWVLCFAIITDQSVRVYWC